jgi:hypothetical protein
MGWIMRRNTAIFHTWACSNRKFILVKTRRYAALPYYCDAKTGYGKMM